MVPLSCRSLQSGRKVPLNLVLKVFKSSAPIHISISDINSLFCLKVPSFLCHIFILNSFNTKSVIFGEADEYHTIIILLMYLDLLVELQPIPIEVKKLWELLILLD
jgi:hypothetical protein